MCHENYNYNLPNVLKLVCRSKQTQLKKEDKEFQGKYLPGEHRGPHMWDFIYQNFYNVLSVLKILT